jgi:hypothetical protein
VNNGEINITVPFNYFASRNPAAAEAFSAVICAPIVCSSVSVGSVKVVNIAATSAAPGFGSIIISLRGPGIPPGAAISLTLGPRTLTTGSPQVLGSVVVSTGQDRPSNASILPTIFSFALSTSSMSDILMSAVHVNASKVTMVEPGIIDVEMFGGCGGDGGHDTQPGGVGGKCAYVKASFMLRSFDQVGFFPGKSGSRGVDCAVGAGFGRGGESTYSSNFSGGSGGNAGPSGCSGGGGGGGAASVLTINQDIAAIAGGGGGGGGGCFCSGGGAATALSSFASGSTGQIGRGSTGDGAGSGGGGGGFQGGASGSIYTSFCGEYCSYGGNQGSSRVMNRSSTLSVSTGTADCSSCSRILVNRVSSNKTAIAGRHFQLFTLSSHIGSSTNVSITISFAQTNPTSEFAFKTVSVAGMYFDAAEFPLHSFCSNLNDSFVNINPVFSPSDSSLSLIFSKTVAAAFLYEPITCVVSAFKNKVFVNPAGNKIQVSTYDASGAPKGFQIQQFPNIYQPGNGGKIDISSNLICQENVNLTFSFMLNPSLYSHPFKFVEVSGLRFSSLDSGAKASCSNFPPSTAAATAAFTSNNLTHGVLLLTFPVEALPQLLTEAIVCKIDGFKQRLLAASWYIFTKINALPSPSDFETLTPSLQNLVPGLNFNVVDDSSVGAINAYSGGLLNTYAVRFKG